MAQRTVDKGNKMLETVEAGNKIPQGYVLGCGVYKISIMDLEEVADGTCLGEENVSSVLDDFLIHINK